MKSDPMQPRRQSEPPNTERVWNDMGEQAAEEKVHQEEVEFLKNLSEEQKTEVHQPLETNSTENVGFLNDEFTDLPSDESSAFELSDSEYDISDTKAKQEKNLPEVETVSVEPRLEIPSLVIKKSDLASADKEKQMTKKKKDKKKKKKKVPKLTIKPVTKMEETPSIEDSLPPIIVKIPKASLSPQKSSKSPKKTPEKESIKVNIKLPKPPAVKSLKILPLSPPSKQESPKKSGSPLKLTIQTPPPLSVIRNKTIKPLEELDNKNESTENASTQLKLTKDLKTQRTSRPQPVRQNKEEKPSPLQQFLELEKIKMEERRKRQRERELAKEKETAAQRSSVVVTNPPTKKTTIAKTDSEPTQQPQQEADTRPAGILQRRNSFQKQREQWVVSDAIKSPSPTPPAQSPSFVAKKSRPHETVSFSLPPGGFNNQQKPKTKNDQINDLFSQYFPGVNNSLESRAVAQWTVEMVLDSIFQDIVAMVEAKNGDFSTSPAGRRKRKRTENLGKFADNLVSYLSSPVLTAPTDILM